MLSLFTESIDATMWRGISAGAGRLLATTLIINSWKISAFWGHSALHHFSPGVRHYQVITSNRTQVIEQINSSFSLMMILKKFNSAVISLLSEQKSLKYAIYVYIWFSGHGHYIDWLFKNVRHQEQEYHHRCYYKRPPQAPQEEVFSPTSSLYVILLFYLLSFLCILSWMH